MSLLSKDLLSYWPYGDSYYLLSFVAHTRNLPSLIASMTAPTSDKITIIPGGPITCGLKQIGTPDATERSRGCPCGLLSRNRHGAKTMAGLDVLPLRETQQFRGVDIFSPLCADSGTCNVQARNSPSAEAELELTPAPDAASLW
jgi:hypothetical protein